MVVADMVGLRPSGDSDADTRAACSVIRRVVARRGLLDKRFVGRGRFLEELRQSVQNAPSACVLWVAYALDRACQGLLLGSIAGTAPISSVQPFALQWHLHQHAAGAMFRGMRKWFDAHPTLTREDVSLEARVASMAKAMEGCIGVDAVFMNSMLPHGPNDTMLVMGLHEACIQHGVDFHTSFGWSLWETMHHLFGKSMFALGAPEDCRAGPFSLLEAAAPYGDMCRRILDGCEVACGRSRGPMAPTKIEALTLEMTAVGERFVWGALRVGGALPRGYNSVHLGFALLKAAEERWCGSMMRPACGLAHMAMLCALRISALEEHTGLPRIQLLTSAKDTRLMAEAVIGCARRACLRFGDALDHEGLLGEMLAGIKPTAPATGVLMLEVQRQLPVGARRCGSAALLWRLFHARTSQALFPLEEYEATAAWLAGPTHLSGVLVDQAAFACARFRDERRRMRFLNGVVDSFGAVPEHRLVMEVQARLPGVSRASRASMQLWRLFRQRMGLALFSADEYDETMAGEAARACCRRAGAAVAMCERVAVLCACDGVRPALDHVSAWLLSRRLGFDRVAHQRAAVAAALRLPAGVAEWHPLVPIVIAEAFLLVYSAPLSPPPCPL
jgi:hypothetical protein